MNNPFILFINAFTFYKRVSFAGVFPLSVFNKVDLQQQITIIFNKRKQPPNIFLPKSCSSAVVQTLKEYL